MVRLFIVQFVPMALLRRIADGLRIEGAFVCGKVQGLGHILPVEGIKPCIQPLGGGKEIDVLADEAGIDLGIIILCGGYIDQSYCGMRGGGRADFGAQVTGEEHAKTIGLGIVDIDSIGENHVELNVLAVHGRGGRATQSRLDCAGTVDAEGCPQEIGEHLQRERLVAEGAGGFALGEGLHKRHAGGDLRLGQIDGFQIGCLDWSDALAVAGRKQCYTY